MIKDKQGITGNTQARNEPGIAGLQGAQNEDAIREIVGDKITLIDTGAAVAKQLKRQLDEKKLLSASHQSAAVQFWTNSQAENAQQVISQLWGQSAAVMVL